MKLRITLFIILTSLVMVNCSQPQKSEMGIDIEKKVDSLLSQMTLEEKVGMIHAVSSFNSGSVERLGIPGFVMSDGPHGVRMEHGLDWQVDTGVNDAATYLPVGITLASTWNKELGYEFGKVLGAEAKYRGKDIILGPGVNILRTPLNGRNFEYLGEDPYLAGKMAVGYIKGVQDQGIAACVKHFTANNQETERFTINVEMSERALREIYLPAFKMAIHEGGAHTIMGAYNQFRGEHCSHNDYLLNKILKQEWGFDGVVVSDWNAVHNAKQALLNGCDIEMGTDLKMIDNPDYNKFYMADSALLLVKSGEVSESVIDDKVRRILRTMHRTHMFDERTPGAFNTKEHQALAKKVAQEGIVLLKNKNILPLKKEEIKSIAVIGANANRKFGHRGGSSQVKPFYEITALEGIKKLCGDDVKVTFAEGYVVKKDGIANKKLIAEAVKIAKNSDLVLYVGGSFHGYSDEWSGNAYDAEAADKPDMKLPFGQDELIAEILNVNSKTIVSLFGGGPVEIHQWEKNVPAILQAWYPGMEGGNALAEILFGVVNPSGKLPMTFPIKLEDSPAHKFGEYPGKNGSVEYNEGIYVGYRYFDTKKIETQYPFGYGLSYTTFELFDIKATKGEGIIVTFNIKNTGNVNGAEVTQLYIQDVESSFDRPIKELKAFEKVELKPGESKMVEMKLSLDNFKYFDDKQNKWVLEAGKFNILVGNSSKNILQKTEIEL